MYSYTFAEKQERNYVCSCTLYVHCKLISFNERKLRMKSKWKPINSSLAQSPELIIEFCGLSPIRIVNWGLVGI